MINIAVKLQNEATVYDPYAITNRFSTTETAISVLNGNISAIITESAISDLLNGGTTLWDKVMSVQLSTDEISLSLSEHKYTTDTNLSNLDSRVSSLSLSLDSFIVDIKGSQTTLESNLSTLTSKYSTLSSTLDGLSYTVGNHTSQIEKKADNTTVTNLNSKITSLESSLSGFKTEVSSTYVTQTDYSKLAIGGRNYALGTGTLQSITGENKENQSTYRYEFAEGSAVKCGLWNLTGSSVWVTVSYDWEATGSNFSGKFRSQTGIVGTQSSTIRYILADVTNTLSSSNKSGHVSFTTQVAAHNSDAGKIGFRLDNVPTTVTIKVKNFKVEIGTKPTDWTPAPEDASSSITELTKNYSTLTQTVDTFKTEVSSTYIKSGTAAGGMNMWRNTYPRKLTGFSSSTSIGTWTIRDITTSPTGKSARWTCTTGGTSGGPHKSAQDGLEISERWKLGATYSWSLYIRASKSIPLLIGVESGGSSSSGYYGRKAISATTSWQKVTHTFTYPNSHYQYTSFVFYVNGGQWNVNDWLEFHSHKVEEGPFPTSYSEHPLDLDSEVISTKTIAEQTSDQFNWLVKSGTSSTNFTLTDRVATLVAEKINLSGLVTFSGLNSSAQSTINTASSNASSALSTANTAKNTADTAKTNADSAKSTATTANTTANNAKSTADTAKSTADTAKSTADTAKSTATTANTNASSALSKANSVESTITNNKPNWDNAYKRVNTWCDNAISSTTTINGGYIKTNTITADKIAIGDFSNYALLCSDNYSGYGFSLYTPTGETNSPWFQMSPPTSRDVLIGGWYYCNGGETLRLKGDFYNGNITGMSTSGGTTSQQCTLRMNIYSQDAAGTNTYGTGIGVNYGGNSTGLTGTYTLPTTARRFRISIQIGGYPTFTGTMRVRNLQVIKMGSGELIVDGAITAGKIDSNAITTDKLAANAVTAAKIEAGTITGDQIKSGTITADHIKAGTITADQIKSGTITADKIKTGSINADHIRVGSITADLLNLKNLVVKDTDGITTMHVDDKGRVSAAMVSLVTRDFALNPITNSVSGSFSPFLFRNSSYTSNPCMEIWGNGAGYITLPTQKDNVYVPGHIEYVNGSDHNVYDGHYPYGHQFIGTIYTSGHICLGKGLYEGRERSIFFHNTATSSYSSHKCRIYGGDQYSTTGIGVYDDAADQDVWYYNDQSKTMTIPSATKLSVGGATTFNSTVTMNKKMQCGSASITPKAANTPTSINVTFSPAFNSTPIVVVTPATSVPGTAVTGVGVNNISTTGCTLWLTRTNTSATGVRWIAVAP